MKVLVTGAAGFIGFHTCMKLIDEGHDVVGIDSLNHYYPVIHKQNRLEILNDRTHSFSFIQEDICDIAKMNYIFNNYNFTHVLNLAAYAGVRYSINNPYIYVKNNVLGFQNILDLCVEYRIDNLVYASSSSVYAGLGNGSLPFSEEDQIKNLRSPYASTKYSNEKAAEVQSNISQLNCTGLRFFTVYGTYSRPDMAIFIFAKALINNTSIPFFNSGDMTRDFTFVDDIVQGIICALEKPQKCKIYNLSSFKKTKLRHVVEHLADNLSVKEIKYNNMPMQEGDTKDTLGNNHKARMELGFNPSFSIEEGLKEFCDWFKLTHSASEY